MLSALLMGLAFGAPTPQEWLEKVDQRAVVANDAHLVLEVTPRGREKQQRTVEIWQSGPQDRLARVTAPAALAGVGLLSTSEGLWVYLPAIGKPRQVERKQRDDSFMGSDFTFDDLVRTRWAPDWTATTDSDAQCGEIKEAICLLLAPNQPQEHDAAAVRLWIDPAKSVVIRADRLSSEGQPFRRTQWSDYREVKGQQVPFRLEVYDLKKDKSSVAVTTSATLNEGVDVKLFTPDGMR